MKDRAYEPWLYKLFLFLRATYVFFDKAAKEDPDLAAAQEAIWFEKLGRNENNYTAEEILDAFNDVTKQYPSIHYQPSASGYEEIVLIRRRKANEKIKEEQAKLKKKLALPVSKEKFELGKMMSKDVLMRTKWLCR